MVTTIAVKIVHLSTERAIKLSQYVFCHTTFITLNFSGKLLKLELLNCTSETFTSHFKNYKLFSGLLHES